MPSLYPEREARSMISRVSQPTIYNFLDELYLLVGLLENFCNFLALLLPALSLLLSVDDLHHHHAWDNALTLRVSQFLASLGVYALAELERDILKRGNLHVNVFIKGERVVYI